MLKRTVFGIMLVLLLVSVLNLAINIQQPVKASGTTYVRADALIAPPTAEAALDSSALFVDTIGQPETVDPAWACDTASWQLISNVYETLVCFNISRAEPDPRRQLQTDDLVLRLADECVVASTPDPYAPPYVNYTVYFRIRQGVYFHNESYMLTPEDVEYSFERAMVQDRGGGPVWMLYKPLLGFRSSRFYNLADPSQVVELGLQIDHAIEANWTHVWFNIANQYDYPIDGPSFLRVLCQPVASVVSKAWAVMHGDWSGDWGDYTGWVGYNNPAVSPLDLVPTYPPEACEATCGTGPYKLKWLDKVGAYYLLGNFSAYWQGWPSPFASGYLERVVVRWTYRYSVVVRAALLMHGDTDIAYIPKSYINYEGLLDCPGVRFIYPLQNESQPMLASDAMFFNFYVNPINSFVPVYGSGSDPNNWHSEGIPYDFFNDVHVRKGFAYILDYARSVAEAWIGGATRPANPLIAGLSPDLRNPEAPKYKFNLTAAKYEFDTAWGGLLREKGFTLPIFYNEGNRENMQVAEILGDTLFSKFLEWNYPCMFNFPIMSLDWPGFLTEMRKGTMPLFIAGWQADFTDPNSVVYPFMHIEGPLDYFQCYWNETVESLIEADSVVLPIESRRAIYTELQNIYYRDVPSVPIAQPYGHHFERDWVQGWYYNPILGGGLTPDHEPPLYFYYLWKSSPPPPPPPSTYSLTVTALGIGTTDPPQGTYAYSPGTVANVTAIPNINYVFDHWELDDPPLNIGGNNSTNITMYWNHKLHAVFIHSYFAYDIAVANVTCKTVVGQGYTANITVTFANEGDYTETFNVTVYADTIPVANKTMTLANGNFARTYTTGTFTWDTTGFDMGNYTVWASVEPVPEEADTADNNCTFNGFVSVTIPGDVNGDFRVNLDDITSLLDGFGSTISSDGYYRHTLQCIYCPHSPNLDIDLDSKIALNDITTTLDNFGKTYP